MTAEDLAGDAEESPIAGVVLVAAAPIEAVDIVNAKSYAFHLDQ